MSQNWQPALLNSPSLTPTSWTINNRVKFILLVFNWAQVIVENNKSQSLCHVGLLVVLLQIVFPIFAFFSFFVSPLVWSKCFMLCKTYNELLKALTSLVDFLGGSHCNDFSSKNPNPSLNFYYIQMSITNVVIWILEYDPLT